MRVTTAWNKIVLFNLPKISKNTRFQQMENSRRSGNRKKIKTCWWKYYFFDLFVRSFVRSSAAIFNKTFFGKYFFQQWVCPTILYKIRILLSTFVPKSKMGESTSIRLVVNWKIKFKKRNLYRCWAKVCPYVNKYSWKKKIGHSSISFSFGWWWMKRIYQTLFSFRFGWWWMKWFCQISLSFRFGGW
jgi:hypothetical protein